MTPLPPAPSAIRRHLTFANVTSCLALMISLGGVSYAAMKLPAHSVGTRELRPNAVTASKLRLGSVKASKLAEGAVSAAALQPGAVTAAKLGFPLFVEDQTSSVAVESSGMCPNSCLPPGGATAISMDVPLNAPATVFVAGTATVQNESDQSTQITLTPTGATAGSASQSRAVVGPRATETVPVQTVLRLPAGSHTISVHANSYGVAGDHVQIKTQLAAIAFPAS